MEVNLNIFCKILLKVFLQENQIDISSIFIKISKSYHISKKTSKKITIF